MSYPDELLKLKTNYEDLNLNNVQALNAYNEAVSDFVKNPSAATYKNVKFVYDSYKDILDKCVVNASTMNDISDAILSLQKYTIEKKKQTVVAPATKVSNVEYPSLNGKVVEQETGDIWLVTQNGKIVGVREKTDSGYSTIYEYKAITTSDIGAVNKNGGDSLAGQYTLSGVFLPASNNTCALGSSSKRWAEVYTKNVYADNVMSNSSACLTEDTSIGKIIYKFQSKFTGSGYSHAEFSIDTNKTYLMTVTSTGSITSEAGNTNSIIFISSNKGNVEFETMAGFDYTSRNSYISASGLKVKFIGIPHFSVTVFEIGRGY